MPDSRPAFRPLRWLAHLPLVILPFLAALVIEGPRLRPALEARAMVALAAAGEGWACVSAAGRDIVISGVAPNQAAVARAVAAVAGTFGVRRVVARVATRGLP